MTDELIHEILPGVDGQKLLPARRLRFTKGASGKA
jgi:hypothetical protein